MPKHLAARAAALLANSPTKNPFEVRCVVHVGGTRCVTSNTDHNMKIHARITLSVEFIRACILLFVCHV